ncbi:MAG: FISUMP domain-containing protein, partial [Methanococcaceae archaeon]
MKICQNCKSEYSDDKRFCKFCGTQLLSVREADPKYAARKMVLEEKIKADPLNISFLLEFAHLLIENTLFDEALFILYRILAIEENNFQAQQLLFSSLKATGKENEAAEIGYKLVELVPDNIDLLLEVSSLAEKKKDYNRALEFINNFIKIKPGHKEAWKNKAVLLCKINNRQESFIAWGKVYQLDPTDLDAKLYLGIEATEKGEYLKARTLIESLIFNTEENSLKHFLALVYLDYVYIHSNQDEKIISDTYSKINEIANTDWISDEINSLLSEIALFLGHKALDKEDFNNALSYFKSVKEYGEEVKSKEACALTYYKMSAEYLVKEDSENAAYYISESLKIDPDNSEAKEKYSEILSKINAIKNRKRKKNIAILSFIALCILALIYLTIKKIQSENEKNVWEKAEQKNTFDSYAGYLSLYPDGEYCSQAKMNKEKFTFTDKRDGKQYKTIIIGNKIWLGQNLNYETKSGSWYYNNDPANGEKYGRLYTWDAAKAACPAGWHLPSMDEFKSLIREVNNNGNLLKVVGEENNSGAGENGIGFSAVLGGSRGGGGDFWELGRIAKFWSSTKYWDQNVEVLTLYRDNN